MFERILLPVDVSLQSQELAGCLHQLKPQGAEEIVLLNVVEMGPQIGFASDTFERMVAWKQEAEAGLAVLQERIEATGMRCHWRLELGQPSLEIVRIAEEEHAALIAMGTHGHGLIRSLVRRSVTGDVVRRAHVPVLVVPLAAGKTLGHRSSSFVERIFRRVLLPTDFSECARDALALVKKLPTGAVNEAVLLHVYDSQVRGDTNVLGLVQERMGQIRSELEFFGFVVTCLSVEGHPARAIRRVAREEDVSLIVVGRKGQRAAAGPLMGRVAQVVMREPIRPILVVPA